MPRRSGVPKREVLPDPVYNSTVVTKVVNQIMLDGKKGIAQEIVYGAFDTIKEKMNLDPMEVFNQAINNIMPVLEVKARRVGGSNYQVPMEIRPDRRQTLAIRWLVLYARKNRTDGNRVGVTVSKKLGKAHVRNRTRRRIREVYRLNEEKFQPGWDIVVVARTKAVEAPFEKLTASYLTLAKKAGLLKKVET